MSADQDPRANAEKEEETESNEEESTFLSSEVFGELIEDLPPKARRELAASVLSIQQRFGPPPNPVFSKLNESHIDKALDIVQRDSERTHDLRKSNRNYQLVYFLA
ncbi:MAG: hypothetical protein OXH77_04830 [Anaerolineaceae bacterium]|nr:hypothetical protein [Anaerolineaceae bacterium]